MIPKPSSEELYSIFSNALVIILTIYGVIICISKLKLLNHNAVPEVYQTNKLLNIGW